MKVSGPKCYRYVDLEKAVAWLATSFAQCEGCLNSEGDVYFDKVKIKFTRGNLKEETHYYPFGLPMAGIGSSAVGSTPNRQKYQSNEYITGAGLNWMSFGARQYDPQLGRFLSVDPLASEGGQDMLSPYHAMGNNPARYIDPNGLKIKVSGDVSDPRLANFLSSWLGAGNYSFDDDNNITILPGHEKAVENSLTKYYLDNIYDKGQGGSAADANKAAAAYAGIVMAMINGDNLNGSVVPADQMDGHIYPGSDGEFQIGPTRRLANVDINGEKVPSAFGRWWNNLLSISFDGGYYFTANTWGESGERRVSHTAKKVNIEWLMPILTMHTPDLNMFNVKMPNFVNYMNGVTTYASGLNAGSDVWNNRNIDTSPLHINAGYYIEIKYLSSDGYYGSRVIPKDSFKNYEPTGDGDYMREKK